MKYVNEFNKYSKETGLMIDVQRTEQLTTGDISDDKVIISTHKAKK
jgi:hypothetical protein